MTTVKVPNWLATYIDEHGDEAGKYTFSSLKNDTVEIAELEDCPKGFACVAFGEAGEGLVVAEQPDQILYRVDQGEIDVYATNETEFRAAIRRDETWEELAENMPASRPFWLGIVLKSKDEAGQLLTLGFKGEARDSAMVIQGRVLPEDMIADALTRELKETLEIEDYNVLDLIDDGGTAEVEGVEEPLFTIIVEVERFDPMAKIQDDRVDWIAMEAKKLAN